MTIENTSTEPIEAWTLFFDGNFTINNIWNAKLLSSENSKYEVANQLWTTPIKAGESASFGFTADKSATENAKAVKVFLKKNPLLIMNLILMRTVCPITMRIFSVLTRIKRILTVTDFLTVMRFCISEPIR